VIQIAVMKALVVKAKRGGSISGARAFRLLRQGAAAALMFNNHLHPCLFIVVL
jgi:hypothetical protein